jgi:hypothetical protein
MDREFLERLGLEVTEEDGVVEATLELSSGGAINPLTREVIDRVVFTVMGDRLLYVGPPEFVGGQPINLAFLTPATRLEDLVVQTLNEHLFQLQRRSNELTRLGISPQVDPTTLQLSAELERPPLTFFIGASRSGQFRVLSAVHGDQELTGAQHVFELSEFLDRRALGEYLFALYDDLLAPPVKAPAPSAPWAWPPAPAQTDVRPPPPVSLDAASPATPAADGAAPPLETSWGALVPEPPAPGSESRAATAEESGDAGGAVAAPQGAQALAGEAKRTAGEPDAALPGAAPAALDQVGPESPPAGPAEPGPAGVEAEPAPLHASRESQAPEAPVQASTPSALVANPAEVVVPFGEIFGAFGEATLPARSPLEVVAQLKWNEANYRFAAARVHGRTFRGLLAGPTGKVWAGRFELGDFPGVRAFCAQELGCRLEEIEVITA